jgi:hypothetical protein
MTSAEWTYKVAVFLESHRGVWIAQIGVAFCGKTGWHALIGIQVIPVNLRLVDLG